MSDESRQDPPSTTAPADDPLSQSVHDGQLPEITESMLLVNKAQRGDGEALNDLLARYEDRLRRIVRIKISARLRRVVESVDIVQDAFRNAFQHIDDLELRSTSSILQWLAKIAENQMLDTHRRHYNLKRDKTREIAIKRRHDDSTSGPVDLAGGTPPPDVLAGQQELAALVDGAVAELSEEYREVIMLRTYYGGSWEEVTQQMGRESSEATRQLHRRARIKLGKLLKARMGGKAPDGGDAPKNLD